MKSFSYVNSLGYNKVIRVDENKNEKGEYYAEIWSGQNNQMETTGMFCGSGHLTAKELNEFLRNYGIEYQFS